MNTEVLPEGFIYDSQANEACSKFINTTLGLSIWIDFDECPPNYALTYAIQYDHDFKIILMSDEYPRILEALNTVDCDYYKQLIATRRNIAHLTKLIGQFTARCESASNIIESWNDIATDLRSIAQVFDAAEAKLVTLTKKR